MASRGTTFAKQDRDRAKKAKAAAKREKSQNRQAEEADDDAPTEAPDVSGEGDVSPEELLRLVEELHKAFADERISFEDFEERKTELMARISVT
ncbi:MAG: hypothetical protein ABIV94_02915 [Acidimicrobiales bacterium]